MTTGFAKGGEFLFDDEYKLADLDKFDDYITKKYGKINVKVGRSYQMTWGSAFNGDDVGMLLVHDKSLWDKMNKDKKLMALYKKLS